MLAGFDNIGLVRSVGLMDGAAAADVTLARRLPAVQERSTADSVVCLPLLRLRGGYTVTDKVHLARLQAAKQRVRRKWEAGESSNVMPWDLWHEQRRAEREGDPEYGFMGGTGDWLGPSIDQKMRMDDLDGQMGQDGTAEKLKELWGQFMVEDENDAEEDPELAQARQQRDDVISGRGSPQEMRASMGYNTGQEPIEDGYGAQQV